MDFNPPPREPDTPVPESDPITAQPSLFVRILEILLLLGVLFLIRTCVFRPQPLTEPSPPSPVPSAMLQVEMTDPIPVGPLFGPPSPQRRWKDRDDPNVYMPTGSGRVVSASYGSVRTRSSGRASFHEGVDVAPTSWKRGRATDPIFSVSDGTVAYINRIAGNSSYGIYIVIRHQDEAGEVYSLYAHLASVDTSLSAGDTVQRGDAIGVMGHSSTLGIPVRRSHLHFELCLMLNPEFTYWYRAKKLKPNHREYHGFNLVGLNPHLLLSSLHEQESAPFSFAQALKETETAWHIAISSKQNLKYFDDYPSLWTGSPYQGKALVLDVSESGIPLSGRNATPEELKTLGSQSHAILDVDSEVLGRNGLRHVTQRNGSWQLGSNGTRWLDILTYRR